MGKSEMTSQGTQEQTQQLASEDTSNFAQIATSASKQSSDANKTPSGPFISPATSKDSAVSEQQKPGSAATSTHRNLNRIIARALEDIEYMQEKQASYQAQIDTLTQERDEIEQRYTHLLADFRETIHMNADEKIRRAAESLRETPGQIPPLFEPIQETITHWLANQQAEREAVLQQKLQTVEHQAAIIRQELIADQKALAAERDKFAHERQATLEQMKTRETWLQHRWVIKAWSTAVVMFLVLPAFQVFLLIQKADTLSIIIIPTAACLVITAVINLVRARKRPSAKANANAPAKK